MAAQVRSMTDGSAVGSQLSISVNEHPYLALKPYPDGSAAYAAAGNDAMSIKVARVMPCR
jgi:hypothetical protein